MGDADEGEDKMLKRARELELEPMAVAETYTTRHFQAMDRMGVIRPDICPRATGHIPEQLEAIEKMIEAGWRTKSTGRSISMSARIRNGKLSNRSFRRNAGRRPGRGQAGKTQPPGLCPLEKSRGRTPHALAGFPTPDGDIPAGTPNAR